MDAPLGLICMLMKSATLTPPPAFNAVQATPGVNYRADLPGSILGGGIAGGLLGAGLGAAGGGLYGYFTAPEDVDPETGQTKSKWSNVWPAMGWGSLIGGGIGTATGMQAGFGESERAYNWLKRFNPAEAEKYKYLHQPEHMTSQMSEYQKAMGHGR